jgi:hypothetical protein
VYAIKHNNLLSLIMFTHDFLPLVVEDPQTLLSWLLSRWHSFSDKRLSSLSNNTRKRISLWRPLLLPKYVDFWEWDDRRYGLMGLLYLFLFCASLRSLSSFAVQTCKQWGRAYRYSFYLAGHDVQYLYLEDLRRRRFFWRDLHRAN